MIKSIKIIKKNQNNITSILDNELETDIVFRELQQDTVGRSGSNPTWGYFYNNKHGKLKYIGIGLHKEHDYDYPEAAYSEKIWSIIGKRVLKDTRVPEIDVVEDKKGEPGIISHRLLDNDKEDMIHIRDILFNKFERDDFRVQRDVFFIEDLLECIKLQINNPEEFEKVKKQVLHTLLLDAITNNADRHPNNWALIRDKKTNSYQLADFDHSSCFTDMYNDKSFCTSDGWVSSYITVTRQPNARRGNCGLKMIEYIFKNYNEETQEFSQNLNDNIEDIILEIKNENLKVDIKKLEKKLRGRNRLLQRMINREELEYEQ